MKTILFLHGFFASGICVPANALREAFEPIEQREQSGIYTDYAELQQEQFKYNNPYWKDKIWGIFGEQDTLAHYKPLFMEHYNNAFDFPGGHTPTTEEVKTWYVPLIKKMLMTYKRPEERYFQHFKGGKYRFVRTAFDSELTHEVRVEPR